MDTGRQQRQSRGKWGGKVEILNIYLITPMFLENLADYNEQTTNWCKSRHFNRDLRYTRVQLPLILDTKFKPLSTAQREISFQYAASCTKEQISHLGRTLRQLRTIIWKECSNFLVVLFCAGKVKVLTNPTPDFCLY